MDTNVSGDHTVSILREETVLYLPTSPHSVTAKKNKTCDVTAVLTSNIAVLYVVTDVSEGTSTLKKVVIRFRKVVECFSSSALTGINNKWSR